MYKITILSEQVYNLVTKLYYSFSSIVATITQKELIIASLGILAGWLITRCYSKLTEKSMQDFTSRELNTAIEPIFQIVEKLETEFNNVTKFYRDLSNEELQKLSSSDIDKTLKPMIEIIERIDDELNEKEIISMIERSYKDKDKDTLKRALFFGSLLKLESNHASVGFMELSSYSPEIFREYIDYLLAKTFKMNSTAGKIFLLTLLRNKFGLRYLALNEDNS